ncbi:hypothetical protein [Paenibacillus humicola]|uniref:hypothetical protein n=1 Tax=Paenibacillus humicola TaxID=3110540 RepID=UPI00237A8E83|nr:hypothetical protein [Paenibacillus humicola]
MNEGSCSLFCMIGKFRMPGGSGMAMRTAGRCPQRTGTAFGDAHEAAFSQKRRVDAYEAAFYFKRYEAAFSQKRKVDAYEAAFSFKRYEAAFS